MTDQSTLKHPLATARGLGSAKEGTEHWWLQRVTAVANVPLAVWFIYNLVTHLAMAERADIGVWFAHPLHALAALFLFVSVTLHARLGLQVVIEDYVHTPSKRLFMLLATKYSFIAAALIAALSIVKLHFFGV